MSQIPPGADTPMLRQYLEIKSRYQDAILFFRLGDFYEMFLDDAKLASKELALTLTGRGKDENRIPMCGVPHHSATSYIAKLVNKGHKVAICEQVEEATGKGLTRRDVVKVITPGTSFEGGTLSETEHNFIVSIAYSLLNKAYGICFADLSTGQAFVCETSHRSDVISLIFRLRAKEILVEDGLVLDVGDDILISHMDSMSIEKAEKACCLHFNVQSLKSFGVDHMTSTFLPVVGLLNYVNETQKNKGPHIVKIQPFILQNILQMDKQTVKNLELVKSIDRQTDEGTLFWVLNETMTSMGARSLRHAIVHPFKDASDIKQRLDAVEWLLDNYENRQKIRDILKNVYDLERLMTRVVSDTQQPRDLMALKQSLAVCKELVGVFGEAGKSSAPHGEALETSDSELNQPGASESPESDLTQPEGSKSPESELKQPESSESPEEDSGEKSPTSNSLLAELQSFFKTCSEPGSDCACVMDLIESAIQENPPASLKDGNVIKPGFNSELDELMASFEEIREWISTLEQKEREATGIKIKLGFNKVFGYYFEVSNSFKDKVPEHYIRKQTLTNAERYITPELKVKETILLNGEDKQKQLEISIYRSIVKDIQQYIGFIQELAAKLSLLDSLQSLATVAQRYRYTRPEIISEDGVFEVKKGRHPVLDKKDDVNFIPNGLNLNKGCQFYLITGPNMAGKSTYMRQMALIGIMAQIGSFVPAESVKLSPIDKLFTRIGTLDNLYSGQSTFMVEMLETASILNNATAQSFIVLDEIGRGTSTFDGMSIAGAVSTFIHDDIGSRTLFATHYHELNELENMCQKLKNFSMKISEFDGKIIFNYEVVEGPADKSYGVHVAEMAGLPPSVISQAKSNLEYLENQSTQTKQNGAQLALF